MACLRRPGHRFCWGLLKVSVPMLSGGVSGLVKPDSASVASPGSRPARVCELVGVTNDSVLRAVIRHQQWPEHLLQFVPRFARLVLSNANQE